MTTYSYPDEVARKWKADLDAALAENGRLRTALSRSMHYAMYYAQQVCLEGSQGAKEAWAFILEAGKLIEVSKKEKSE